MGFLGQRRAIQRRRVVRRPDTHGSGLGVLGICVQQPDGATVKAAYGNVLAHTTRRTMDTSFILFLRLHCPLDRPSPHEDCLAEDVCVEHVRGGLLEPERVKQARQVEVKWCRGMGVWGARLSNGHGGRRIQSSVLALDRHRRW